MSISAITEEDEPLMYDLCPDLTGILHLYKTCIKHYVTVYFLDITNYVEYSNENLAEVEIEIKFQHDIPTEWNDNLADNSSDAFKNLKEEYVKEQTKKFSGKQNIFH